MLQINTLCFSQGNPSYSLDENNTQDPEYETIAPKNIETRVPEDGGAQGMKDRHGGVASGPVCDCNVAYEVD